MSRGLPTVSVVVPVRDDPRLVACLAALREQTYPAELVQVVVVDNGSCRDPAPDLHVLPRAELHREPVPGSYAARNAGLRVATGEVLAFTDADCLPEPTWLAAAVAALRDCDVVAGHVEVFARSARRPLPVEAYEVVRGLPQEEYARRGACATANLVTTRAVLDRVGAFDAGLTSGGDVDWTRRATASGALLRYVPEARVRHPARRTLGEACAKSRRVQLGAQERARRSGEARRTARQTLVQLRPPLGALRRARSAGLPSRAARASYVVGELVWRWAAVWASLSLRAEARRAPPSAVRSASAQ